MHLKDKILSKGFAVALLTLATLALYTVLILGCTMQGGGIDKLYWVSIDLVANGQSDQHLTVNNVTSVQIGYIGLCTNTQSGTQYTCFPRESPPPTSSILTDSAIMTSSIALQKRSLYPIPAFAGILLLPGMILLAVLKNSVGKKKAFVKGWLALSATLGLAGAFVGMATGRALEGANELFGWATEIRVGGKLGVLSWVAAGVHCFVVAFVSWAFD